MFAHGIIISPVAFRGLQWKIENLLLIRFYPFLLGSKADESATASSSIAASAEVTVVTVEGGRADLPCDIEAKSKDDSVYLVLWYRKTGTPIYR